MMNFYIKKQESYSRGELLLRSFFGWIYILIPHYFVLIAYSFVVMFMSYWVFFSILFTRKFPKTAFDFIVKFQQYSLRLNARFFNLSDGYPPFGLDVHEPNIQYDMPYTPEIKRRRLLVRVFFGIILLFPHIIVLYVRLIGLMIVNFIAFWAVLFTGQYPDGMFKFTVETLRYSQRVGNYLTFYTDEYPPFHGRVLPGENEGVSPSGNEVEDHIVESNENLN